MAAVVGGLSPRRSSGSGRAPYLFQDYGQGLRRASGREAAGPTRGRPYRAYPLFMTFAPMALLLLGRPVGLVVTYASGESLFMHFLAGTLLLMNDRRSVLGPLRNGPVCNALQVLCLALSLHLAVVEVGRQVVG